ncbi:DUF4286 family protein [Bordetella bronchiseptica]|uniref:DUF4286 family protein n=1 Tax=Bordetella bronchiseptica TaxID=518 RepID=UPI00053A39CB|nr:DUF4286 family protein [Bordetella bronchiseptica]
MNPHELQSLPLAPRLPSTAVLAIWNDIDPEIASEYELWYQHDHIRDRAGTPGFRSARRYQRVAGAGREYFTFSDLESIEASRSPAYLERLRNPTEWTRRMMPHFRRLIRTASHVSADCGEGTGGIAGTAVFDTVAGDRLAAIRTLIQAEAERAVRQAGITRLRLFEGDAQATGVPNPEAALRPDPPRTAGLALVLEGTSGKAVANQLRNLCAMPLLAALPEVMPASIYQLIYSSQS